MKVKQQLFLVVAFLSLINCNKKKVNQNCGKLPNINASFSINLNLPEYNNLKFTSNTVLIPNQGNGGIIIINSGNEFYRAWDALDPNHPPSECSKLELDGIEASSNCNTKNTFNLFTGQPSNNSEICGLKEYFATKEGNIIYVNN